MTILAPTPAIHTLADLVERLGSIPLDRIRFRPSPGTATEADVIRIEDEENRLCELVEGVLVEKPIGFRESLLATALIQYLREFVAPGNLGLITGEGGMLRLFAGLVRIPDVAFTSWARLPGGKVPDEPIPDLAPDLAVEVLSRTNTPREMRRKRDEYFEAGVTLVWIVDPDKRTVTGVQRSGRGRRVFAARRNGGRSRVAWVQAGRAGLVRRAGSPCGRLARSPETMPESSNALAVPGPLW